jgi:hypothetical protein
LFEDFILGGVVEVGVGEGEGGRDMLTISLVTVRRRRAYRDGHHMTHERSHWDASWNASISLTSDSFVMAERQNDWIIEDSEEEDELCAAERDPVPPGVHHFKIGLVLGFQ